MMDDIIRIECEGCGALGDVLEYLPEEGMYYCPLCGVRTPDDAISQEHKPPATPESAPLPPERAPYLRLTLDQLRPYDRNPRRSRNPKFDSILASIEARGLDCPPNVSRRPGESHYLIVGGGKTRLEILNILYDKYKGLAETAASDEERLAHHEKAQSFYIIDCIFKPWESESSTLAVHMSENEKRGDTLFIEKALAVQELRRLYEEEDRATAEARGETWHGKPLAASALAERITAQGWRVSHTQVSRFENELLSASRPVLSVVTQSHKPGDPGSGGE